MHDNRVLGRSGLVEAIENGKENFKLIIDRPIKMIFFRCKGNSGRYACSS